MNFDRVRGNSAVSSAFRLCRVCLFATFFETAVYIYGITKSIAVILNEVTCAKECVIGYKMLLYFAVRCTKL